MDADKKHVRLSVDSVLKDGPSGGFLKYSYAGTIDITGPAGKVLGGAVDAKTTDFGEACERSPVFYLLLFSPVSIFVSGHDYRVIRR